MRALRRSAFKGVLVWFMILAFTNLSFASNMASYMGNILSNFGNLEPKAYHSQQRGYFVGGTMRIPPLGQTINPFEITMPSYSNDSCGGINVMMGGFSYLNFDYLVQKLQAIIQAAPALAFEIALRVLSEQLFGSANTLESIVDALNGLNFNSCTAMNGIVTTASNAINNAIKGVGKQGAEKQASGSSDSFSSAVGDFFDNVFPSLSETINKIKNAVHASGGNGSTETAKQEVAGIPKGGLLKAVGDELGGLPDNFIDTMRYYLGDVIGVQANDNGTPTQEAEILYPCGDSATAKGFVEDLDSGQVHSIGLNMLKSNPGTCFAELDIGNSLRDTVQQTMQNIYNALITNDSVSQQGINLIEISSIPLYSFLRDAALLKTGYADILIEQLSKPISINIASVVAGTFLRKVISTISHIKARLVIGGTKQAQKTVNDYIEHLITFENQLADQYLISMNKANAVYKSFLDRYRLLQTTVEQKLGSLNMQQAMMFQKSLGW